MRKTVHFLGGLIFVALLFVGYSAKSQLFYNNGASVTAKEGAIVFVDGIVQNQTGQIEVEENTGNNAEFIIQDNFVNNSTAGGNGFYRVLGDWINNNIFNAGTGTVFLEGGNQLLDGSVSTTFNNLTLDGTGLKTQTIDQFCVGILDLKNLELQNETYGFFVQNTDVNAIIRTSGFVSALNGGFLSRQTNSAAVYLFPVGSSVGTLRYRPVELTPDNATANTYTVRMANVDATTETFDRSNIESGICEINPLFYHQIDRSAGTAGIDLSIFYDESTDGTWDGISNWTSVPQWDIVSGSTTINGVPLDEAYVNAWNDFSQIPYGLYTILPDPSITDPGSFCENDAATDLNAATAGGTWSGTGITNATNGTFDPTSVTPGTYTITYDVGTGSCTDSDQIDITVNPIPDATITDPGDFCSDDAVFDLTAATAGGTWSGTGITNATNGTFDPSTANIGVNNITYQVTVSGCVGTDNISIQVNALPNVNTGADFDVCEGDNINLSETGGDATSWTWTGPGTFSPDATTQNPSITNATPANSGTYAVEVQDINGCIASDDVLVTVNANPTTPVVTTDCSGGADNGIITVTAPLGGNYEYSIDGITFQAGTSFGPLTNGTYNLTVLDTNTGCTATLT
ncbi:MAG: hypothetical protein U9N51_01865, partial [Bacteroidota bacterium]|nr:hypothetical protein [Bacteroidota bacterium]